MRVLKRQTGSLTFGSTLWGTSSVALSGDSLLGRPVPFSRKAYSAGGPPRTPALSGDSSRGALSEGCLQQDPLGAFTQRELPPRETGPVWGLSSEGTSPRRPALSGDSFRRTPSGDSFRETALRCAYSAGTHSSWDQRLPAGAAAPMRRSSRAGPLVAVGALGSARGPTRVFVGYPG